MREQAELTEKNLRFIKIVKENYASSSDYYSPKKRGVNPPTPNKGSYAPNYFPSTRTKLVAKGPPSSKLVSGGSNDSQTNHLPSTSAASACANTFSDDEDQKTEEAMLKFLEQSNDEGKTNADQIDTLALIKSSPKALTNVSSNNENMLQNSSKDKTKHLTPEPKTITEKIVKKANKYEDKKSEEHTESPSMQAKEVQKVDDANQNILDISGPVKRAPVEKNVVSNVTNGGSGSNTLSSPAVKLECKALVDGKVKRQIFPKKD